MRCGSPAEVADLARRHHTVSYEDYSETEFVALNIESGEYFLMDRRGRREKHRIGRSAADLLDWLWERRRARAAVLVQLGPSARS